MAVLVLAGMAACAPAARSPSDAPGITPRVESTATAVIQPSPPPTAIPAPATTAAGPTGPAPGKEQTSVSATPVPTPVDPASIKAVTQAKDDLAKRLRLRADQIDFVSFEPVTWPDGSLGCPQPGMMYTQVLVEGFRIKLRANARVYEYHGSATRAPFLCEQPR